MAIAAEPEENQHRELLRRIEWRLTTLVLGPVIAARERQAEKAMSDGDWETAKAPVVQGTLARMLRHAWKTEPSASDAGFPLFRDFIDQQHPPVPLFEQGATWRYLDQGQDPGQEWNMPSFSDSIWKSGPAPLGFSKDSEDGEVTPLEDGDDPFTVTYYFRRNFQVPDSLQVPNPSKQLRFEIKVDDGAVVYVNGKELFRVRMPDGPIDGDTEASLKADERRRDSFVLPSSALQAGANTIAVEVHQSHGKKIPR